MTGSGLIAFSTVSCASAMDTIRYKLAVVADILENTTVQ